MAITKMIPFIGIIVWLTMSQALGNFGKFGTIPVTPFFSPFHKETNVAPSATKLRITPWNLEQAVSFSSTAVSRLAHFEQILLMSEIQVQKETPSYGQVIESQSSSEALQRDKNAEVALKASLYLVNSHCSKQGLQNSECSIHLLKYKMHNTSLANVCKDMNPKCSKDMVQNKYRSIDGSCNNPLQTSQGKAFTSYKRLLFPHYKDGIQEPRRSVTKKQLPSARLISANLVRDVRNTDNKLTLAFMEWGQFIEHDLAHTVVKKMSSNGASIECCHSSGRNLSPRYIHPFCNPISIPSDDPFYSKYDVTCMNYVRSVNTLRSDCSFGPIEQMNQATHFLDASHIYGSTLEKSNDLRQFFGGRLLSQIINGEEYLPNSDKPEEDCQVTSDSRTCFKSGDSRVNSQPHLVIMHTIWLREHNRIAAELAKVNPMWDDEKLYQESRRIVIAEIQHITYNQWKPLLLGNKLHYTTDSDDYYSVQFDPSVSNSFATAAVRYINSLMDSSLRFYSEDRKINKFINLRDYFNRPQIVTAPGSMDSLVRGLASQESQTMDINYISDLTNYLFKYDSYGFDILSLDIQRGRDHGLPSYNVYRDLCGLPKAKKFEDFGDVIPKQIISNLRKVYNHPDDVDLLIGGLAESDSSDRILGYTFTCLIEEQLERTRKGDRYFYTHKEQPVPFTKEQLNEINKVSLARIFCDNNKGIEKIQKNVFKRITERSELLFCSDQVLIPRMNFKPWADEKLR